MDSAQGSILNFMYHSNNWKEMEQMHTWDRIEGNPNMPSCVELESRS